MAPTTTFPVLPLAHPRILFPTSRLTVPVDRDTALAIQALLQEKPDGRPHILAVPSLSQSDDDRSAPQLADMGTVARVIRVVKTPATRGNDFVYFVLLHGVGARAHLTPPLHLPTDGSLARVKATPVDDAQAPSNHLIEPFRSAALVMLTRLAADPSQSSRNEGWRKVREVRPSFDVCG
jgi:ATP-dependent Lon protease